MGLFGFRLVLVLAVLGRWAAAAPVASSMVASRLDGAITLDGHLDEPAWAGAAAFDGFVEAFPTPGKAPDFRTTVRVVFDDRDLYVGIECFDPRPEAIVRNLGRRDTLPASDWVELALDSNGDHRTAYDFTVNAAGVLRDQLLFGDVNSTDTWDAVWDARVAADGRGWTVEVKIPLRVLRFTPGRSSWGVWVRRNVPRTHQTFDSTVIPREANPVLAGGPVVSRFGRLEGLDGLKPKPDVELTPYAATRAALRPLYSEPTLPTPRLWDPSIDLGVDLKLALTSTLSLNATLNPDFGQVDADLVIQNLTNAEAYFPEKRPFFLQGLDLFQPVGSEYETTQQLFYSRRVGLTAPILAAVKLSGSVADALDLGVLDAVVMGAGNPRLAPLGYLDLDTAALAPFEAVPDRRWQPSWRAPLHFAPNDALPAAHPVSTNFLALVARQRLAANASVGATLTAATPLEPRCLRSEFASDADYLAADCASRGANALGLDWNLRTADGEWGLLGQADASQHVGGEVTLADGVRLSPWTLGYGGYLRGGKLGGEPFRFDLSYVHLSPTLDLNASGFQPLSNIQWADLNLHFVRPNGLGPFRSFHAYAWLDWCFSADGRWLPRGLNANLGAEVQLASFDTLGLVAIMENPQYDTREVTQLGLPFQRLPRVILDAYLASDPSRPLVVNGDLAGFWRFGLGPEPASAGWAVNLSLKWQPSSAVETRLEASVSERPQGARFIDQVGSSTLLFGTEDPTLLSVTLRQLVVLTPRLTVQLYAQLFSGAQRYTRFWTASRSGASVIDAGELSPSPLLLDNPNVHSATLNLNLVFRWEYRLGSTLYVVYSRAQHERARSAGELVPTGPWPSQLFSGPATDTFLVKWAYWWTA